MAAAEFPHVEPRQPAAVADSPGAQPDRVLLVDDEAAIRLALSRFLRARGYAVETVDSGAAALAALRRDKFQLMLCDVRMPGITGLELVPPALAIDPDLAVVMLSAVNDAPTATRALLSGAYDYLNKPVELPHLRDAVTRALERRARSLAQRRAEQLIREEVAARTSELEQERRALGSLTVNTAEALVNAMEAKDVHLRGHSQRVAELAASIGEELGLDEDTVEAVRLAGRLMDVGKIGTRESVLNKAGALTPEEFEHVKEHVRIGMEILGPLRYLGAVLAYVHDHHERMDGTGYPRGLKGEEITIGGRILAAADAFDALTSTRAYRGALTATETLAYLQDGHVGTMLDPRVFDALCAVVRRRKLLVFIDE
jgi:response regulator RpfG family c-di-GMP phosphodiesterase